MLCRHVRLRSWALTSTFTPARTRKEQLFADSCLCSLHICSHLLGATAQTARPSSCALILPVEQTGCRVLGAPHCRRRRLARPPPDPCRPTAAVPRRRRGPAKREHQDDHGLTFGSISRIRSWLMIALGSGPPGLAVNAVG